MGNWMRIQIKGTCKKSDVPELFEMLTTGDDNFHCLVGGGWCGLPNWAATNIDVVGNLAERDYSVLDVKQQLMVLGNKIPSLVVDVHCGGLYESNECVNTVRLHPSGKVEILYPQQKTIPELDWDMIQRKIVQNRIVQNRIVII